MKLLFLDTETTGLNPKLSGIVQIAGIVEIDGVIKEEFDIKCRPFKGDLISPKALEVQGRTMDQIREFQTPDLAYDQLKSILSKYVKPFDKADKFYMIGQNTKFDYDFLDEFFKKNNDSYIYSFIAYHLIDLIALTTTAIVSGKFNLPNMKLETVAKHFGIPLDAHNALNDIRATREIFHRYVEIFKK